VPWVTEAEGSGRGLAGRAPGLRVAVALGLVVSVSACFPARFSGFRPAGPGTLESSHCTAGTRDVLRLDAPSGVVLFFWAGVVTLKDDGTAIGKALEPDVRMTVPTRITVRLTSPVIRVASPEWSTPREFEVVEINDGGPRRFGATDALPVSPAGSARDFYLEMDLPGLGRGSRYGMSAPRRFTLLMPPLEINAEAYEVPPVSFESYTAWGIYTCVQ